MSDRALVYTTTTGDKPWYEDDWREPFCFVCSRCTDHFAEHDDLVEQGLAFYGKNGSVYTKAQWDSWANPALAGR